MGPGHDVNMITTGTSSSVSVPKLQDDGSNWVDYKDKVRTALGAKGLLRHVNGTAIQPKPFKVDPVKGVVKHDGKEATEADVEAQEEKLDEFERKEYLAQHILKSTISARLSALAQSKNALEIWKLVEENATKRDVVQHVEVRRKMMALQYQEDSNMNAHLRKLADLKDELIMIQSKMTDEEYMEIIILSIPNSFRTILTNACESAKFAGKTIKSDDIISSIL